MKEAVWDVFISHATSDKAAYVIPLTAALSKAGVSFWLDAAEISWGDSITMQINRGLQRSRYVLLCLSSNYLARPWPEHELSAALAIQNDAGIKRVLPLICDSQEKVLQKYPLLAGLMCRNFSEGPDQIAGEIKRMIRAAPAPKNRISLLLESVHTGETISMDVPRHATIDWVRNTALRQLNLKTEAEIGTFKPLLVHWVLVQAEAQGWWDGMSWQERHSAQAVFLSPSGHRTCYDASDRIDDYGVGDGAVFHLCALGAGGPDNQQFAYAA